MSQEMATFLPEVDVVKTYELHDSSSSEAEEGDRLVAESSGKGDALRRSNDAFEKKYDTDEANADLREFASASPRLFQNLPHMGESDDDDSSRDPSESESDSDSDSESDSRKVAIDIQKKLTAADVRQILKQNEPMYLWCKIVLFVYLFLSSVLMGWGFRTSPGWFSFLMFVNIALCLCGMAGCLIRMKVLLLMTYLGLATIIGINVLAAMLYLLKPSTNGGLNDEVDERCEAYKKLNYDDIHNCNGKVKKQLTWEIGFLVGIYVLVFGSSVLLVQRTYKTLSEEMSLPSFYTLHRSEENQRLDGELVTRATTLFKADDTFSHSSARDNGHSAQVPVISSAYGKPKTE